jgi:ribonucleoside-diphosphate reductase alpha chain
MQAFIDNSISKTINFPIGTLEEDVAEAYMLAWELNCKGITVYVTGSRESVVLETADTANKKADSIEKEKVFLWNDSRKPRPKHLRGDTFEIDTPVGKAFVTINYNGGGQPFEVFLNTAKAGSETAAVSEAIGRLISLNLRIASPVEPRERLETIKNQLTGIGGGRSMGFGQYRVRSLPDGVAKILEQYLEETDNTSKEPGSDNESPEYRPIGNQLRGDLCPECGQASVINEEGCAKCYSCGHSEC